MAGPAAGPRSPRCAATNPARKAVSSTGPAPTFSSKAHARASPGRTTATEERLHSYANSEPTPHGGTHVTGFRDGVAAAVNAYLRECRLLAEAAPDLSAAQIGDGLTAVVSVKPDRPEFSGSTRGMLAGTAVRVSVAEAVQDRLRTWLDKHPEHATAITDRIIHGTRQD
ncbi:hypothetical protein [Streptomyces sp. NPDC002463]|uniref:hypothetical protein n=1 Tax=Streptomyces sp. NPDC002463 TaxID=3364645 RepID=UPI00369CB795